jgi:hypothetical protein
MGDITQEKSTMTLDLGAAMDKEKFAIIQDAFTPGENHWIEVLDLLGESARYC